MNASVATACNIRRKTRLASVRDFTVLKVIILFILLARTNVSKISCNSFSPSPAIISILRRVSRQRRFLQTIEPTVATLLCFSIPDGSFENDDDDSSETNYMKDLLNRVEAINVEQLRDQLERSNTQRFLKHSPWKLPYNDARLWIQANLGPSTKEEFYDLVENGNLRTPYIPKRPEEYYRRTREWISWDHFLTGLLDQEHPSAIQPATGFFD